MGDIVPFVNTDNALALRPSEFDQDPLDREKRIKDAQELETKLKWIQENVPTRIYNVCSSSAGAGSGDFHQYRMIRRAEQDRVKSLEEDWKKKEEHEEYEAQLLKRKQDADERTNKRRAKRHKKKDKKKAKAMHGSKDGQASQEGLTSDDENAHIALD